MSYAPPDGNHVAINFQDGPYTPPDGNNVAIEFVDGGGPPVDTQYSFPESWASSAFGDHDISNWKNYINPAGWNSLSIPGSAQIYNNARLLRPTAWASQAFGAHLIRNNSHGIWPSGIASKVAFGTHWASLKTRTLRPSGFYSDVYGTGSVSNYTRHLGQAGNIASKVVFGLPEIKNLNRRIDAPGVLGTSFGATAVSLSIRSIQPAPMSTMAFGNPWASFSPRQITPEGIYSTRTGQPSVGGTRYLNPEGFIATRFGTRIIPESQSIYPQGMNTLWGTPYAYNARTIVFPLGFIPNGNEQNRIGSATAYNSRQYLHQQHSPDSEAMGEKFGQWLAIANRNREIRTYGHDSAVIPRQYIENKARPVYPTPWAATLFGNSFVADAIRSVRPEPIDPPYIGRWNAVLNTAKTIKPASISATLFGSPSLENTRRYFNRIGNFDSQVFGYAFVDFSRRSLRVESRHSIGPPSIPLPVIDNLRKYIEPAGRDQAGYGSPFLSIHRNIIYPRFTDQSRYGSPSLRNLTPELYQRGKDSQEFGATGVHLYTRYINYAGVDHQLFGISHIRDKKSIAYPLSWDASRVSTQATIQNLLPDPPITQRIFHSSLFDDYMEIPEPVMNQRSIYPHSTMPMTLFGSTEIHQNVIRVEPGFFDYFSIGTPFVSLKNRFITPDGINLNVSYGRPRFVPHTIWAATDAPAQAITNHGGISFHPVDFPPGGVAPFQGIGVPRVKFTYDVATTSGADSMRTGLPSLILKRHYIRPEGWKLSRVGWHEIPEFIRHVNQYGSPLMQAFGAATVIRAPYLGPQTIYPVGMRELWGQTRIELFNREVKPSGWLSQLMGFSRSGPTYMRQSLWVGAPDWPKIQGFDASRFGASWISLRVREVKPNGGDFFVMDYDLQNFDKRMRVRRGESSGPPSREVHPVGVEDSRNGLPNVRNAVHFIRPDGNSDGFRKGVPIWETLD